MSAFRRVEDERAGPEAIGILVPPSRRTFLILRPRSLPWDLLVVNEPAPADQVTFREMSREEASGQALALFRALQAWAAGGPGGLAVSPAPDAGFRLLVKAGSFALVVCDRMPGRPYQPEEFVDRESAECAGRELAAVLCPGPDAEHEVYFNTRHFSPTGPQDEA
jgi:hypothetical protein